MRLGKSEKEREREREGLIGRSLWHRVALMTVNLFRSLSWETFLTYKNIFVDHD